MSVYKKYLRFKRKTIGGVYLKLTDEQKEVLDLRVEGKNIKMIAGELGLTQNAVQTRLTRVRRKIQSARGFLSETARYNSVLVKKYKKREKQGAE